MSKWIELNNRHGADSSRRFGSVREAVAVLLKLQESCYQPTGLDYQTPLSESGGPTESDINLMLDLKRVFYASQRLCDQTKFEIFVKHVFCNVPLREFDGMSATTAAKKVRQVERVVESVLKEMDMLRRKK
jgi:hypothetical protein